MKILVAYDSVYGATAKLAMPEIQSGDFINQAVVRDWAWELYGRITEITVSPRK